MANPNVPSFELTLPDGTKVWVSATELNYTYIPVQPEPEIPLPPVLTIQATATADTISVSWDPALDQATYGRDGTDTTGYGPWTSEPGTKSPQSLTGLKPDTKYSVTVAGLVNGTPLTKSITVTTAKAPVTTPPVVTPDPTPTPTPTGDTKGFRAMTIGAAVTDAANGNFNKWAGKRHGLYSTWGSDGKIWAIDVPTSEYAINSVARLGDFDLDVAPQRKLGTNWADAAAGKDDAKWRADITELKAKWGDRKGTLYYRPWHEFNGDWYQWSVRNAADQANFVKAWIRLHGIWKSIVGSDTRFKLGWSPNRDSKYGLDVRKCFPGAQYVDVIEPDYYDFALRLGASNAEAETEKVRTQNGGGPVGIVAYINFAKSVGLPVMLPEWGVQFGDNTTFLNMILPVFEQNRYTGQGDPAGKVLGMAWHNLLGQSVDPNAGGDFFITQGGKDYGKRPNASKLLREWITKSTWLRTV